MNTKIELGKIYKGWYFQLGKKEVFIITDKTKKTTLFLSNILKKLYLPDNPDTRAELKYYLMPANLEIKYCPASTDLNIEKHYYYNIFGKNFCGYGSDNINDEKTIIINM